jgi:hypothetical protein
VSGLFGPVDEVRVRQSHWKRPSFVIQLFEKIGVAADAGRNPNLRKPRMPRFNPRRLETALQSYHFLLIQLMLAVWSLIHLYRWLFVK